MLSLFLVASFLFFLFPSLSQTCYVTFYSDSGFGGKSLTLYAGQSAMDLTQNGWNDQISSLRFTPGSDGTHCWVHACWNTQCSGSSYGGATDYIDDTPSVGFANDQFSALQVSSYRPNVDAYVMYYKSCLNGSPDYSWFSTGTQNIFRNNFEVNHIGNDALSALVVSQAAAVILYSDDNWQGNNLLFTGQTVTCLTAYNNWNDVTSSARQYDLSSNNAFVNIAGGWQLVGSGNKISQTITIGYTTTESTTTTNTITNQFSVSMKSGFSFMGASGEVTVSASTSSSIATAIASSVTKQYTSSWTTSCDGTGCPSGQIGLYSFEMSFSRPWNDVQGYQGVAMQLATSETACICSSYSTPNCPPMYCNDPTPNSCSICKAY